jgi:SAM-dependent methyltransferase
VPVPKEKNLYPSHWHLDFFRGVALEMWRRAIPIEQTQAEANFLEEILCSSGKPSHLLDIPCGNGRHGRELLARGHRITGVDRSEEFLQEARDSTKAQEAEWILADMRDPLPPEARYDGAFCFGNSFGYLDYAEAGRFLSEVARCLRRGGRFVVETGMAAESILPAVNQRRWYELDGLYMLSSNRYNARESRLDIDYTFICEGKVETRASSSYVLTANELCRLHQSAGLKPLELYASIAKDPYQFGSQRLIVVSEKL